MKTYKELKFMRERLWARYQRALFEGQGQSVTNKLWDEYETVNEEYQQMMGRK